MYAGERVWSFLLNEIANNGNSLNVLHVSGVFV